LPLGEAIVKCTSFAAELTAEKLQKLFADFKPRVVKQPLSDFARLHTSVDRFCELSPRSAEEVADIVGLAAALGIPLRTRGNGHALNGSSLPRAGELVISTSELTAVAHLGVDSISVGAGAILWDLNDSLRSRGLYLPVINDGYRGPSVGGYVAAGGFGPGSATAGGFWNNVASLTIVDGRGALQRPKRNDALFPWIFGAMGQLGIVVEAELDVATCDEAIPLGRARDLHPSRDVPDRKAEDEAGRLFWFTLFVRSADLDEARARLKTLEQEHPATFAFRNRYTYFIHHRRIVAPLLWPAGVDCYAVGSWGIVHDAKPNLLERILAFDHAFTELAMSAGYRRYLQSEVPAGPALYSRYFGADLYARFRAHKDKQDPSELFNRGWVFPWK
jgi:FAD/FMN-containing dehydrogenase